MQNSKCVKGQKPVANRYPGKVFRVLLLDSEDNHELAKGHSSDVTRCHWVALDAHPPVTQAASDHCHWQQLRAS